MEDGAFLSPQVNGLMDHFLEKARNTSGFENATVRMNQDSTKRRQKDGRRDQVCSRNTRSGSKDVAQRGKENREAEPVTGQRRGSAWGSRGSLQLRERSGEGPSWLRSKGTNNA